ncbi:MAG: enolase C-terminal domain-like protein [Bacteroidota bacterium]
MKKLSLHCRGLFLPMKATFKQGSSVRKTGESVWVVARRATRIGLGEGCPRPHVTGEKVADCLEWLEQQFPKVSEECQSLEQLQQWVADHREEIDQHPAAWCAAETALLDLLARENGGSVEKLLGLSDPGARYTYTAVLSDGKNSQYKRMLNAYLGAGFNNFKIKMSGDLLTDQQKLDQLLLAWKNSNVFSRAPSIRLDANNLWKHDVEKAVNYLNRLRPSFWAIEEPLAPRAFHQLSQLSQQTGKTVILDESLCTLRDLEQIQALPGQFVANIKVSRVGGVLRALELIEALRALDWKIIIGAHVAETSVMTRAGMLVAQAAGPQLIGQEGGYGTMLLEQEPVDPSLVFGFGGIIDLTQVEEDRLPSGAPSLYSANWQAGWGLHPIIVRD